MNEMEKLERMEKFLKYNIEIKRLLYLIVPKEENRYNEEYLMKYTDDLEKVINDIEYYIGVTLTDFNFPEWDKEYFNKFIAEIKKELYKIGSDYNKLKQFYEKYLYVMSEQLVNEVGKYCVGYSFGRGVNLSKAKTINEILHVIHQTIVNNENNLQKLPKLKEKNNSDEYPISLYGKDNDISTEIFNKFPLELSCGYTDIVSLSNGNIIMMVRDRGHALSIEIEKEHNKYYVRYFIPKICNVDMVNSLRGVRKVTNESKFTTGIFECEENDLLFKLFDFISKVPTDMDMLPYNYKETNKIL